MSENADGAHQPEEQQVQPVLVAVDFSDDAKAAVIWACQFAESAETRVILLHVVHDPASLPGFYRSEKQEILLPMQDVANSMMVNFLQEMKEANPELKALQNADTRLVRGLPPGRIIEAAELLGAQLIVIGSRGLTGLPHLMLGSVAERVVELAPQPVVVIKNPNRKTGKKLKKKQKKMWKAMKNGMKKRETADG